MPEPNEEKVTFSEAQQAKVDLLIRESMGRAGSEARATAARLEKELQAAKDAAKEAETLRAELATLKGERTGLESSLTLKEQEAQQARDEAIAFRKRTAIAEAGVKFNFYDPGQLAKLVSDDLKWDGKRFVVLGSDGTPRVGLDGASPLSVDEFFREFSQKNPHLVRGEVKPGIGSREAQQPPHKTLGERERLAKLFGRGSDGKAANDLAMSDPAEYKRLRHIARRSGLI